MIIDEARVVLVRMPLNTPWKTSFGAQDCVDSVLVRLSADGVYQWGEATPGRWPAYGSEWGQSSYTLVSEHLLPRLIGRELRTWEALQEVFACVRGNTFAKAAIETAWWALRSRLDGTPLTRLAGAARPSVPVGADFDIHANLDELIGKVAAAVASGCPRVKFKVSRHTDLDGLATIRRTFPEVAMHVDCNGAFTLDDMPLLERLDGLGLSMIEQPLRHDDLLDHATAQRRLATPLCLDESVTSVAAFSAALDLGSCRFVNVKPGRVGGFRHAVTIGEMAAEAGVGVVVGNMLESPIGAQLCLALAACPWATYPADIFPWDRFFPDALAAPDVAGDPHQPWHLTPPHVPGNPAQPDPDLLRAWTVADTGALHPTR